MPDERPPGARTKPEADPWSLSDYRRLISWEGRLRREAPFLEQLLAAAPRPSVVDLGCGTGEHVAWFADRGARALGIDRSEDMIRAARAFERQGRGRFLVGDLLEVERLLEGEEPFALALCLGNVLPHVGAEADLERWARALARILLPGGTLALQVLNYVRLRAEGARHLPLSVREEPDGRRVVFLRLIEPDGPAWMRFLPTTLVVDPRAAAPVQVTRSVSLRLRTWTREELSRALEAAGFSVTAYGDVALGPFEVATAADLILVARRP